ncbi:MAG: polysaccharide biosynthesis C-terminal domain-containing protein [Bacteroidales bacterium]|nr:polysaccharide biosynthesis C-terminal domain-containing protein [Bacteroidales bacterium]
MKIALHGHYGYRRLVRSSIPSIVMMLVGSIYSVVDGLFVSNFVGTTAFAALNVIWPAVMIIGALGLMVGTGGTALVSMTKGMGEAERANVLFSMLIRFTVLIAVVFMIPLYLLMEPLARVLGAEGEMVHQCVIYGRICTVGLPGFMLQMCFQSFYMTAEKPQLGTLMSIVCAVTNIALDALFIVVFHWGLAGAAAASMTACFVGGFFPLWYFRSRFNNSSLRLVRAPFERKPILKTCSNGLSEYVGNISWNVLAICYNLQLLKMMGENGVAAYSVLLYYGYIFAAVFFGYNLTVTPIIGYNYGAEDKAELRSLLRHSIFLLLGLGSLMTLVSELLAEPAARLFVGYDPELSALTKHAIRLYMISFFIAGVNIFTSSWFTGLNNGKVSAVVSFIRNLVFELGFVFLLPVLIGPDGIWLAVDAADFCCLILSAALILAYRKRYGYGR